MHPALRDDDVSGNDSDPLGLVVAKFTGCRRSVKLPTNTTKLTRFNWQQTEKPASEMLTAAHVFLQVA